MSGCFFDDARQGDRTINNIKVVRAPAPQLDIVDNTEIAYDAIHDCVAV